MIGKRFAASKSARYEALRRLRSSPPRKRQLLETYDLVSFGRSLGTSLPALPLLRRQGFNVELIACSGIGIPTHTADGVYHLLIDMQVEGVDCIAAVEDADNLAEDDFAGPGRLVGRMAAALREAGVASIRRLPTIWPGTFSRGPPLTSTSGPNLMAQTSSWSTSPLSQIWTVNSPVSRMLRAVSLKRMSA